MYASTRSTARRYSTRSRFSDNARGSIESSSSRSAGCTRPATPDQLLVRDRLHLPDRRLAEISVVEQAGIPIGTVLRSQPRGERALLRTDRPRHLTPYVLGVGVLRHEVHLVQVCYSVKTQEP